jgi:hypothetical protein
MHERRDEKEGSELHGTKVAGKRESVQSLTDPTLLVSYYSIALEQRHHASRLIIVENPMRSC